MKSHEDDEHDDRQDSSGSSSGSEQTTEPRTIATDNPVITSGPTIQNQWKKTPDSTMVIETSRIREPVEASTPSLLMVPAEDETTHRSKAGDEPDDQNRPHSHAATLQTREERAREADDDREASAKPPSMTKILLFSGLVALICGIAGAWGYSYFFGSSKSKDQQSSNSSNPSGRSSDSSKQKGSSSKSGNASDSTAETGKEIPGFTRADDAETLRKQNQYLAERIDRLRERLDKLAQPRNQTPPDIRTLQIKVGNLAQTVEDMGDLPTRLRRLEGRLEDLSQQVKSLKTQTSESPESHGDTTQSGAAPMPPTGTTSRSLPNLGPRSESATDTPSDLTSAPDAALTEGIKLFREGRYREAQNILRKLQLTRSRDARVWYFSALSRGLLTGDWGAETRRLVARGLEQEKAGQPPATRIDAALSGLTKSQGKDWLASFRTPAIAKR